MPRNGVTAPFPFRNSGPFRTARKEPKPLIYKQLLNSGAKPPRNNSKSLIYKEFRNSGPIVPSGIQERSFLVFLAGSVPEGKQACSFYNPLAEKVPAQ